MSSFEAAEVTIVIGSFFQCPNCGPLSLKHFPIALSSIKTEPQLSDFLLSFKFQKNSEASQVFLEVCETVTLLKAD